YVIEGNPTTMDTSEQGFLFKLDASPSQRPAEQQLSYFFIYQDQPVGWSYDARTNGYLRLGARGPEIDNLTGDQLWFKNIVVMEVDEAPIPNDPKGRLDVQVLGEGAARVFLDGAMREATWRKDAGYTPLRFYDSTGAEIALNAGPVWIAAVASLSNLTVKGGTGSP
nr:DUF3048 C-terminal domain-containing protein [Chloroflexaceae bacterium]